MGKMNQDPQTIVVLPSLSFDPRALSGLTGISHYEERFLFLLILLRQPNAKVVYLSSEPILPSIIEYYLHLLPGVIPSNARRRLFLVSPMDGSVRPLTEKLLERPRLLDHIRSLVDDPHRAHIVPFNTTELERELALRLDVPIYGPDPKHLFFGTKSGGRRLFADEGVPHPAGREDLTSLDEVVKAIVEVRTERPGIEEIIVKTNGGLSGLGNVDVDLRGARPPGDPGEAIDIEQRFRSVLGDHAEGYLESLGAEGGVVEERVGGEEVRSPSVQFRITPLGEVEILSTHDQVLGGDTGQVYLGARFPADPAYARRITDETAKVADRLAREGVIGRAGADFVVVRRGGTWKPWAIELNLRRGGTTHPFLTLQFLTDGVYRRDEAVFVAPSGKRKYFVASDHVEAPTYRGLTPEDLFDVAVQHGLHFNPTSQTGIVFHMMGAISEIGRTGLTAVADSPAEADGLCERTQRALDEAAQHTFVERWSR